jgi:hypothetical protein
VTLALVGANLQYTVALADRRLTSEGSVVDEEFQKLVAFSSPTARMAVAFAGLATAPGLTMNLALPECLLEAAKDGPQPEDVVEGVARRLEARFSSLPSSVTDAVKQTAVLFAGYRYDTNGRPEIFVRSVGNYRPGATGTEPFRVEMIPDSERYNYMSAVGARHALADEDMRALGELINGVKPPQAVVGKAVEVVRAAALSRPAQDVIGGQLLSLVVPANRLEPPAGAYHTEFPSDTVYFPSSVDVDAHGEGILVAQPSVTAGALTERQVRDSYRRALSGMPRDTTQRFPPIAFPRTARNAPCPCGSGQKYKRCHGR